MIRNHCYFIAICGSHSIQQSARQNYWGGSGRYVYVCVCVCCLMERRNSCIFVWIISIFARLLFFSTRTRCARCTEWCIFCRSYILFDSAMGPMAHTTRIYMFESVHNIQSKLHPLNIRVSNVSNKIKFTHRIIRWTKSAVLICVPSHFHDCEYVDAVLHDIRWLSKTQWQQNIGMYIYILIWTHFARVTQCLQLDAWQFAHRKHSTHAQTFVISI